MVMNLNSPQMNETQPSLSTILSTATRSSASTIPPTIFGEIKIRSTLALETPTSSSWHQMRTKIPTPTGMVEYLAYSTPTFTTLDLIHVQWHPKGWNFCLFNGLEGIPHQLLDGRRSDYSGWPLFQEMMSSRSGLSIRHRSFGAYTLFQHSNGER